MFVTVKPRRADTRILPGRRATRIPTSVPMVSTSGVSVDDSSFALIENPPRVSFLNFDDSTGHVSTWPIHV